MPDWMFLSIMAGGVGALAIEARRRAARTRRRSARLGMTPRADLLEVPAELQRTVLWALCEGGTERSVVGGRLSLAAHDLEVTCFDLEDLRAKRFEWAWLDVDEPFRLHTPLSVVACALPRRLPHLLIKRAGPADRIEAREHERSPARGPAVTSRGGHAIVVAGDLIGAATTGLATRAALAIADFHSAAEEPPPTLARQLLDVPIAGPWRAWASAAPADEVRRLAAAVGSNLDDAARGHEYVIETLGPLVLAYAASGGPQDATGMEDLVDFAVSVCERALAAAPELGPRGVEG